MWIKYDPYWLQKLNSVNKSAEFSKMWILPCLFMIDLEENDFPEENSQNWINNVSFAYI